MRHHGVRGLIAQRRRVQTTDSRHLFPVAAIMDLHTRKIVGRFVRDHLFAELATSALMMAIQRQRPNARLIQHSGRGIQCAGGDDTLAQPWLGRHWNVILTVPTADML